MQTTPPIAIQCTAYVLRTEFSSSRYDNLGRVIKRILPMGQEEIFSHDAVGNKLLHTDFNGNTTSFEYNSNNKLVKKIFKDSSEEFYSWSASGLQDTIIDSRGTTLNLYDIGNRLEKAINPDGKSIEYFYYNLGNKTAIIIGTDTTKYTYDELNRLKTVIDFSGGVTTYSYNKNGNRESVTYPNGTKAEYTYDAFGLLLQRSGSTENDYLYTGEQYDPNVGFYYLRARYYNPLIGRFHTMDSWPGMLFEPASLHKYLYCENGPIGSWDPSGENTLVQTVAIQISIGMLTWGVFAAIDYALFGEEPDVKELFKK